MTYFSGARKLALPWDRAGALQPWGFCAGLHKNMNLVICGNVVLVREERALSGRGLSTGKKKGWADLQVSE